MVVRITMNDETSADDVGYALANFELARIDTEGCGAGCVGMQAWQVACMAHGIIRTSVVSAVWVEVAPSRTGVLGRAIPFFVDVKAVL